MSVLTIQDLLYLVGGVCLVAVTIFLCWALYEIARLVRQANFMVTDTRQKVDRFEKAIMSIGERIGNVSQYLGFIAEGGKQLLSFLHGREEKKAKSHKKEKEAPLSDMPEEG